MIKMNTNIYICSSLNKPLRKNMQKSIPMVLAFTVLLALILCCACASQSSPDQTSQNFGFTQITQSADASRISFDEARQKLREYGSDLPNEPGNLTAVYYIHARDVDGSGNATSWIFGVRHGTGSGLVVFDRSGWTTIPWIATLPSEVIDIDSIASPDMVFRQNNAAILGNTTSTASERRDLELQRGIYTLTITSGNSIRILTFNATTGVLIT
jgi:ABC-type transport system substrate-binding protein